MKPKCLKFILSVIKNGIFNVEDFWKAIKGRRLN